MNNTLTQLRRWFGSYVPQAWSWVSPRRDWYVGAGLGMLGLCVVMVWSVYMYVTNRTITVVSSEGSEFGRAEFLYPADLIQDTIEQFAQRAERFSVLQTQLRDTAGRPDPQAAASISDVVEDSDASSVQGSPLAPTSRQPDATPGVVVE